MTLENTNKSTRFLIIIATFAGMLAGIGGVIIFGGFSDEDQGSVATAGLPDSCPVSSEQMIAIKSASQGEVAAMLATEKPLAMRDLTFSDADGAPLSVGSLAGKTLLINLWATWCAPCREEMPALNELQAEMGDDKFQVSAVNVDTGGDDKPKAFLKEIGIDSLGFYREPTLVLFNSLKRQGLALGLPVTLLVSKEGCLLAHMNGPAEWASDDAKALIRTAIGGANRES